MSNKKHLGINLIKILIFFYIYVDINKAQVFLLLKKQSINCIQNRKVLISPLLFTLLSVAETALQPTLLIFDLADNLPT